MGFPELADRLKEVKPLAQYEACVKDADGDTAEALALYTERLDQWFERTCGPIYRDERRDVVRPQKALKGTGYSNQSRTRASN
jgi:hypothetical protein